MKIEQFVMAYQIEEDCIRALLPDAFESLRPVLRINSEIRCAQEEIYLEMNTPVEGFGRRGWLNIGNWSSKDGIVRLVENAGERIIETDFFRLSYKGVGVSGGCPAERDNDGCFYLRDCTPEETSGNVDPGAAGGDAKSQEHVWEFKPAEVIGEKKEFCDCEFAWHFHEGDAYGKSQGKTLPAPFEEKRRDYEKKELSAVNAATIPCRQVLGSYRVLFSR